MLLNDYSFLIHSILLHLMHLTQATHPRHQMPNAPGPPGSGTLQTAKLMLRSLKTQTSLKVLPIRRREKMKKQKHDLQILNFYVALSLVLPVSLSQLWYTQGRLHQHHAMHLQLLPKLLILFL